MTDHLPRSALDPDAYPSGPDGMAAFCAARVAELNEQEATTDCPLTRKAIRKQRKLVRSLLSWAKTRAGYTGK